MPSGPRIRTNNVQGTVTDNPLTNVATTLNSAGLANLAAVSSAHALIILDPLRVAGAPEMVIVTAHTAAATSATISRAAYGTSARQHNSGTAWVHATSIEDVIQILTSSTRPSDPYKGQFIFETDTNKLVGYGGTDWAPRDAGGTLGYAQVTANQTLTVNADLTGLSVTVTVGTGRRILITGQVLYDNDNAAANRADLLIMEGATQLADGLIGLTANGARGEVQTLAVQAFLTPTAGAHTYKLRGQADLFNVVMTASATNPAFILVEDVGAA